MDQDLLNDIYKWGTCGVMSLGGGRMVGMGVAALFSTNPVTAILPLTLGSLQLGAAFSGCGPGEVEDAQGNSQISGCAQITGGVGSLARLSTDGVWLPDLGYGTPAYRNIVELRGIRHREWKPGAWGNQIDLILGDGTAYTYDNTNYTNAQSLEECKVFQYRLDPIGDAACGAEGITLPPGPEDIYEPRQYIDNSTDCTYNVTLQGYAQAYPNGPQNPVFLIESTEETRASGSRIGGCVFPPTLIFDDGGGGGGKGPTFVIPMPDGDGGPSFWADILKRAIPIAIGNVLASAIKDAFTAVLTPASFEFVAPCNYNEDGSQEAKLYQLPQQNFQSRVVSQQAVIMEILQQHLNWKTPVCFGNNEKGAYFRSLAFESTPDPDNNYQRTVKRFRYRSDSPCDVGQLATHWRDFVWNTGPVIVQHTGSALGSLKVWAASVDEGKRVIQHAGREAGVDPDQVGKWTVGGTNSSRYGVRATVRLKEVDGIWAATSRVGPNDWPPSSKVTCDI